MAKEWRLLDPKALGADKAETRSVRGVRIELLLSPYDVPDAMRGYFDERLDRFVIEFRYIDREPIRKVKNEHLVLRVGKHSRRLYGIEVDVEKLKVNTVGLEMKFEEEVTSAMKTLEKKDLGHRRRDNYRIAKKALRSRDLIGAMAGAG